jgi:hypothetical protein
MMVRIVRTCASAMSRSFIQAGLLLTMSVAVSAAQAQPLNVLGQAGVLGEWELTADLNPTDTGRKQVSGPLLMKHVGLCTQDGPEERKGELRLKLSRASQVEATLLIGDVTCTYQGRKDLNYTGTMRCPGQRDVPLLLWLK